LKPRFRVLVPLTLMKPKSAPATFLRWKTPAAKPAKPKK
jgi:hypothetical protein